MFDLFEVRKGVINMTYEEAKVIKQQLNELTDELSKQINSFEKIEMGLTPDHVRESKEYQEVKQKLDNAMHQLRVFNKYFMKTFKKEYTKDRARKRNCNNM